MQFELGTCLLEGVGTAADPVAAAQWFGRAVEAGHAMAASALADCYQHGRGVAEDFERARELHQSALAQGITPDRAVSYEECLSLFEPYTAGGRGLQPGHGKL